MPYPQWMRLAVLDLGSNSFHLVVAEARPGGSFAVVAREKEMLRLGEVVARHGHIPEAEADLVVAAVRRLRSLAGAAGATEVRACATSAFREASNTDALLARLRLEAGVHVRVIGGMEEARLVFRAVRASVLIDPGPALALDLGGGSLELMVGDNRSLHWARSVPLGVGRLTAESVRHDPPSAGDIRRLTERVDEVLAPLAAEVRASQPTLVVGTGGTFRALARVVTALRTGTLPASVHQRWASLEELRDVAARVDGLTTIERRRLPGLDERRAELIPAGLVVALGCLHHFGQPALTVGDWALREGIILDVLDRLELPDDVGDDPRAIRKMSVLGLARRCRWDEGHATHVANLATALFDLTRTLHRLPEGDRELLQFGALLHDIGEHISPDAHHKHTAYLVEHGGLRGLLPEEVAVIACLGRYHLRGDPKTSFPPFATLEPERRAQVRLLVALLRIADGLDRSRSGNVVAINASIGASLRLSVTATSDPELELWAARRKADLLRRALGRPVVIGASSADDLPTVAYRSA